MTRAFISYSHRDEAFRDELLAHLAPLRHRGLIEEWHDRRLVPGDPLDDTISAEMEAADLVLMLVSSDFVQSRYCYGIEMNRALERHRAGEARAISIICRPCHFQGLPFASFVLLPTDARAIALWPNRDAAWVDVVSGIERGIAAPLERGPAAARPVPAPPAPLAVRLAVRPGLRLPRAFTELDRRDFLDASFDRIWAVIEAHAAAAEADDPRVVVRRVRIDAQTFNVRMFVDGREVAGGLLYHGGDHFGRNHIAYAAGADARRGTVNESFSLEEVDGELRLRSGGMMLHFGQGRQEALDADAVADLLWEQMVGQARSRTR